MTVCTAYRRKTDTAHIGEGKARLFEGDKLGKSPVFEEEIRKEMDVWLDRVAPWLELLETGVRVTVELVKGRPKLVATVVLTGLSSVALYRYITKDFDKWERMGIAYEKGHFPYGSFNLLSQHMFDHVLDMHKRHRSEPYCGWFMMRQPVLNINDPELLKHILVKDFNSFVERSSYDSDTFLEGGKYDKIWGRQLTSLKGEEWKQVET